MDMKKLRFFFIILLVPVLVFSEGTKELRPTENDKGSLLLLHTYSRFGQYGAPAANQIKIRIADTTERIFYGFNNRNGIKEGSPIDRGPFVPGVPYRIISPSGKIIYTSTMPAPGTEGYIETWAEAVAGPAELGNPGGYDAKEIIPEETGDYVIEFNPLAAKTTDLNGSYRMAIDNFDFTVAGKDNKAILGRLHSQGWQFSTEKFENRFYGKVYPYDGGNAVYKVDFNGLNPLVFILNFNAYGTQNTGNFYSDRKSRIGNFNKPQFEIFLNPPDEQLYPVVKRNITMESSVEKQNCNTSEYCLNYTTNAPGYLDAFLDFNNNGRYDPMEGEVYFARYINGAGTQCILWDGKDAQGKVIRDRKFKINSRFGFGPMNLPLYDAEHNRSGYKIDIVRPSGSSAPIIFWDDSQIIEGSTLGDPLVNLEGCNSSVSGCHRWENRGSIDDSGDPTRPETINTWWYSEIVLDTFLLSVPYDHQVKLSFHETFLVGGDTTVCKGDTLNFYVFDNKKPHYDLTRFTYQWYFNDIPVSNDIRSEQKSINERLIIKVKATENTGLGCVSYDSLLVKLTDPIVLEAEVNSYNCTNADSYIKVKILSGPANSQFYWEKFPSVKSGELKGLSSGTYKLTVKDPNYSDRCGTDTSFTILKGTEVVVAKVDTVGTYCYNNDGKAVVKMLTQGPEYEYSWDNGPFTNETTKTDLHVGKHKVFVRDPETGCNDEQEFSIPTTKLKFGITRNDVMCNNNTGMIDLEIPFPDYVVYWNKVATRKARRDSLISGRYSISVRSEKYPFCVFDTAVVVNSRNYSIPADFEFEVTSAGNAGNEFTLTFTNLSDKAKVSKWDFGDGKTSDEFHPTHTYSQLGDQLITLYVQDSLGCPGIVRKPVRIAKTDPCGIAFPNAFSPNNDYKHNDIGILGYAPKVELKIFNRWGEVIFRTFEISKRWDGYYRNEPCPVGVYPFILDWECPAEDGTMRKYQKVGDVTLLR
jgi:gliding motility-associated-like protein